MKTKKDVQPGTLALMVLKTLDVLGPLHGYGVARRIEQISGDLLFVNQGTLYPVLLRLEQEGAVESDWGPSENNRRARFYRLTRGDANFSKPRSAIGSRQPRSSLGSLKSRRRIWHEVSQSIPDPSAQPCHWPARRCTAARRDGRLRGARDGSQFAGRNQRGGGAGGWRG